MAIFRVSLNLATLLLVGAASAHAQTPGMICGTVTDAAGVGLAGVTVTLQGDASTPPSTIVTATQGDYRFPSVSSGTYTLLFTLDGFKKAVRPGVIITTAVEWRADQPLEPSAFPTAGPTNPPEVPVGYSHPATGGTFTKTIVENDPMFTNAVPPHPCSAPR